jgi:hypothetical protein
MISPGYQAIMLALEANRVIELRLMKIARGGVDAVHEVLLMVQEKETQLLKPTGRSWAAAMLRRF